MDLLLAFSDKRLGVVNKHHIERYIKIVEIFKNKTQQDVYLEKHHILPKSIFPEYRLARWNIVSVPPRVHFILHKILSLALPDRKEMQQAVWFMLHATNKEIKITSKCYSRFKTEHSKNSRRIMSKTMTGTVAVINKLTGEKKRIPISEFYKKRNTYKHLSSGKHAYKYENGEYCGFLRTDDPIIKELGLVSINKGQKVEEEQRLEKKKYKIVRDLATGKHMRVRKEETSNSFVNTNTGMVNVVVDGVVRKVTQEEYHMGKFTHQNKNKITVVLESGEVRWIDKDELESFPNATIKISDKLRETSRRNITAYNKNCKGKVWLTSPDGKSKQYEKNQVNSLLEDGFRVGRVGNFAINKPNCGKTFYNDGLREYSLGPDDDTAGLIKGRLKRNWVTDNNESKQILSRDLDEFLKNNPKWRIGRK